MKSFFEEYGLVILGILAVIVLICMVSPLGTSVQNALNGTVTKFDTSVKQSVTDAFDKVSKAHKEVPTVSEEDGAEADREDAGSEQHLEGLPESGELDGVHGTDEDLEQAIYVVA